MYEDDTAQRALERIAQIADQAADCTPAASRAPMRPAPSIFRSTDERITSENYRVSMAPVDFPELIALSDPTAPDPTAYTYDDDAKEIQTCFVIGLNDSEKLGMQSTYQHIVDFVSMITGHANQMLYKKIKSGAIGKSDYVTQGDYRARLMHAFVMNTGGFLAADQALALKKTVDSKAVNLHTDIIKTLFAGVAMPSAVFPMLEKSFDDLKGSILKIGKDKQVEGKHIFLILRYFEKNALGVAEAKIRLFLFKMTSDIKRLTAGKSSYNQVHLEMNFAADQYIFNDKIFSKISEDFDEKLVEAGKKSQENYSNVDVPI